MHWSIRTRFVAFTGGMALGVCAVGYFAVGAAQQHRDDAATMSAANEVLRHHMEVDMMHDALRADVLSTMVAASPEELAAAVDAGLEHVQRLREEHAAARERAAVSPALRGLFDRNASIIDGYARTCASLLDQARRDGGLGTEALATLLPPYEALELANERTRDEVVGFVQQTRDAAAAGAEGNIRRNYLVNGGVIGLLLVAAFLFARSILSAIGRTANAIRTIGDTSTPLVFGNEFDRIGQALADAIRAQSALRDEAQAAETRMRGMMNRVESNARGVATASDRLDGVSRMLSESSRMASTQAEAVSSSADDVSKSVANVASAVGEMNTSINEISRSVAGAVEVAQRAVMVAEQTNTTVRELGDASQDIGNVLKVITGIAEQTNLLALNATIEAARAGESGKGFAVVASEVKELARETARATEDIGKRILSIQNGTRGAVDAIGRIGEIIHQIHEFQNTIASAVEEQTVMSVQIQRSLDEAARGSGAIAHAVTEVAAAARDASAGTEQIRQAALGLSENAQSLRAALGTPNLELVHSGGPAKRVALVG